METVVVAVVVVVDTTAATIVGNSGSKVVRDVGSSMVTLFWVLGVGKVALEMPPLRLPLMVGGGSDGGAVMLSINELGTKSTYGLCCRGT